MLARLTAVALLAGPLPVALPAQTVATQTLHPGTRIRVVLACVVDSFPPGRAPSPNRRDALEGCGSYEASFARLSGDSMVVVADDREMAIARSDIRRVKVRRGTRGHSAAGAAIGAGLGVALGLVSAATTDCSGDFLEGLCHAGQIASPFVAGAMGAGVGALIGLVIRSDRWEDVPLRVAVAPRLQVGVSLGF
jgi:hypothetical protein